VSRSAAFATGIPVPSFLRHALPCQNLMAVPMTRTDKPIHHRSNLEERKAEYRHWPFSMMAVDRDHRPISFEKEQV
jgi:hypothetical protein